VRAGVRPTSRRPERTATSKAAAGTEPTAEQKAADAAKAALEAAVDDKWSPKLADGQKLDDAALKEFRELAKKGGFKAGQAQSLVEFQIAREAAADKAATEGFAKQRESWRESLKKDPEFGGANYEKSLRNVQRAMTKFGASETFKKFADAGAGDHPEFVKFVAAIGADLGRGPRREAGRQAERGVGRGRRAPQDVRQVSRAVHCLKER
jgi:hypothetical protein